MAPGTRGNPAGKPRGTPHKATRAALALRSGEAEGLARKAVELALAGYVRRPICPMGWTSHAARLSPALASPSRPVHVPRLRRPSQ
jgi:hypothetical protein